MAYIQRGRTIKQFSKPGAAIVANLPRLEGILGYIWTQLKRAMLFD